MKKKLLTAAVLAALTLSTASVFANPVFSGDAKIEFKKNENAAREFDNRIRLNVDADIDNDFYVHGRVKMTNDVDAASTTVAFDQAYLGMKLANADVKAGKQALWLGKGLLADDNVTGVQVAADINGSNVAGFYGKDGVTVSAVDFGTSYEGINFGASYIKKGDVFYGVNADTQIADGVVLNAEYVKNNDTKAKGYLAEVKFGNAVNKGDVDYSVSYRDIDAGAVTGYATEANYNDSKGFKVGANYKVNNNASLAVSYDLAKDQNDVSKKETDVKFTVNF